MTRDELVATCARTLPDDGGVDTIEAVAREYGLEIALGCACAELFRLELHYTDDAVALRRELNFLNDNGHFSFDA